MSDDDLWRPKDSGEVSGEGSGKGSGEGSGNAADPDPQPEQAVNDETQPLSSGGGSTPSAPPPPPSPSYETPMGPGAVPPPQNPYGQSAQQSPSSGQPGQPAGQQQAPFGGQPYAPPPNPYQAPSEYAAPQSPYGAPYQPAYAGGMVSDHPSATTAMVLGIIGLVGVLTCGGITLLLSPAAWVVGRRAVREIDASPGRYAGRERAQAGKIMGIIGTVLLALGVLVIIGAIALVATVGSNDPQPVYPNPTFQNG